MNSPDTVFRYCNTTVPLGNVNLKQQTPAHCIWVTPSSTVSHQDDFSHIRSFTDQSSCKNVMSKHAGTVTHCHHLSCLWRVNYARHRLLHALYSNDLTLPAEYQAEPIRPTGLSVARGMLLTNEFNGALLELAVPRKGLHLYSPSFCAWFCSDKAHKHHMMEKHQNEHLAVLTYGHMDSSVDATVALDKESIGHQHEKPNIGSCSP